MTFVYFDNVMGRREAGKSQTTGLYNFDKYDCLNMFCVCLSVCVYVCVGERERERESSCVCVCVCVCVRDFVCVPGVFII